MAVSVGAGAAVSLYCPYLFITDEQMQLLFTPLDNPWTVSLQIFVQK
jgi:hypothetical protein